MNSPDWTFDCRFTGIRNCQCSSQVEGPMQCSRQCRLPGGGGAWRHCCLQWSIACSSWKPSLGAMWQLFTRAGGMSFLASKSPFGIVFPLQQSLQEMRLCNRAGWLTTRKVIVCSFRPCKAHIPLWLLWPPHLQIRNFPFQIVQERFWFVYCLVLCSWKDFAWIDSI